MTRWKYEFPKLVNLDENPATGARSTYCSSGNWTGCYDGSCITNTYCTHGDYATICGPGSGACSFDRSTACAGGSGVSVDNKSYYACDDVKQGCSYGYCLDGINCTNGNIACYTCTYGTGTKYYGCKAGNSN